MVIVDILSIEQDDSCTDLINGSNDFEAKIKNYLSDENNIKRRLRFFASKYDSVDSGHREKNAISGTVLSKISCLRIK